MKIRKLRVAALMTATACATMMMLAACGEKPVEHTHTLQQVAAVAATCTTAGAEAYYKCTDTTCGKLFSDADGKTEITAAKVVPAKGHSMTKHEAVTATCIGEGTVEYYTCANEAADVYYADNQGAQKLESISTPKTAHQLVAVPEKSATCAATGTEAYWNCLTCQHKFSDDKGEHEIDAPIEIPKSQEHGELVLKMTQDEIPDPIAEGGSLERVCSVCGESVSPISYVGGFKNVAPSIDTNPSCELSKVGVYYATTSKTWRDSAYAGGEGYWYYANSVCVYFKVTEVGRYTIKFDDLIPQSGVYRILSDLGIGSTECKDAFDVQIADGMKDMFNGSQLDAYDISFDKCDLTGSLVESNSFSSMTINVSAANLSGSSSLYVKLKVTYIEKQEDGGVKVLEGRQVPLLITLTKEALPNV